MRDSRPLSRKIHPLVLVTFLTMLLLILGTSFAGASHCYHCIGNDPTQSPIPPAPTDGAVATPEQPTPHHCDRQCSSGVLDLALCECVEHTPTPGHRTPPPSTTTPGTTPPATATPGPGTAPTATPMPSCSGSWWERRDPTMSFKYKPDYPVVVGQDRDRRGVDLFITGTGGKVIHHYRRLDVVGHQNRCIYSASPPADWDGCDLDTDGDGNPDHPDDPHWNEASMPIYACRWHTQEWDDPVIAVDVDLQLTGESREWIEGKLRERYPGARVKGTYPWPIRWNRERKGMTVDYRALKVQLPDPGRYRAVVTFTLRSGRTFKRVYRFPVYMVGDTLIR